MRAYLSRLCVLALLLLHTEAGQMICGMDDFVFNLLDHDAVFQYDTCRQYGLEMSHKVSELNQQIRDLLREGISEEELLALHETMQYLERLMEDTRNRCFELAEKSGISLVPNPCNF